MEGHESFNRETVRVDTREVQDALRRQSERKRSETIRIDPREVEAALRKRTETLELEFHKVLDWFGETIHNAESELYQYENDFRALQKDIEKGISDPEITKKVYDETHRQVRDWRDRLEDLRTKVSRAARDDRLTPEQRKQAERALEISRPVLWSVGTFLQRFERYRLPNQKEAPKSKPSPEREYKEAVEKVLEDVTGLEQAFEYAIAKGKGVTEEKLRMFHKGIGAAMQKIWGLDASYEAKGVKGNRIDVRHIFRQHTTKLLERLTEETKKLKERMEKGKLTSIRGMHRRVRAEYVALQHTLSEEQRQAMRQRMARLTSLVRSAEDEEWQALFGAASKPVAILEGSHPDIHLAMARATSAAAPLAEAALQRKR